MSQNANRGFDKNSIFSALYRNRVVLSKGNATVINLSIGFFIISFLCAPWLVIIGGIVALAMGYRFSFTKNSPDFGGSIDDLVQNAAGKVKGVVNSFRQEDSAQSEASEPQGADVQDTGADIH